MSGKKLMFVAVLLCLGKRCEPRCTVGGCPLNGWVKLAGRSCLKIYPKLMKTWAEAEAICRVIGRGSHLVRIVSDDENLAIKHEFDLLGEEGAFFWIGLNDIEQEKNRTWIGHQYEENMFDKTEDQVKFVPDPYYNCGVYSTLSPIVWTFEVCNKNFGFICQQPLA